MTQRADNINPAMLSWARKASGLSAEEAARKIGLGSSARGTATEKLQALETGEKKPTRKQLERMAKAYWRPLTTFYLESPPRPGARGADFRQRKQQVTKEDAARLDALLRNLCARQSMVRSLLEDDDGARPLSLIGTLSPSMPVTEAAARIRVELGVENAARFCREHQTPERLFAALRRRVEELGIFVLLAGDLGSHHTKISEKAFRGFAIADDLAPFIVINSQNAEAARTFTLLHELTHILLGSTGVSAPPEPTRPATTEERIERFCNDVASEFLLPEEMLPAIEKQAKLDLVSGIISKFAGARNLSEPMVAYRLWRARRIPDAMLRELLSRDGKRWAEARQRQRGGVARGSSYYIAKKSGIGEALLRLVARVLRANELTHTEAARILDVSSGTVGPLLKELA